MTQKVTGTGTERRQQRDKDRQGKGQEWINRNSEQGQSDRSRWTGTFVLGQKDRDGNMDGTRT